MEDLRGDLQKACESLNIEEDIRELALKMLDRCFTPAGETLQTAQVVSDLLSGASIIANVIPPCKFERIMQVEEMKRLKFACLLYLSKKVRSKDPAEEEANWGLPEVLDHFKLRYRPS